jgi:hypothetical protein
LAIAGAALAPPQGSGWLLGCAALILLAAFSFAAIYPCARC